MLHSVTYMHLLSTTLKGATSCFIGIGNLKNKDNYDTSNPVPTSLVVTRASTKHPLLHRSQFMHHHILPWIADPNDGLPLPIEAKKNMITLFLHKLPCRHHTYRLNYTFKSLKWRAQYKGKHVVDILRFEGTSKWYEWVEYTRDLTCHETIKNL